MFAQKGRRRGRTGRKGEKEESENVEGKPNSQMRAATTEEYGLGRRSLRHEGGEYIALKRSKIAPLHRSRDAGPNRHNVWRGQLVTICKKHRTSYE